MKFGAVYCLYDDHEFLEISLESVVNSLDKVLFLVSDVPWFGPISDNSCTIQKIKDLCSKNKKLELIQGHWINEAEQRNFGLSKFFSENIDYCFIVDSDEVYHKKQFEDIKTYITQHPNITAFHIHWNTYWSKKYYVISPRENFNPLVAVKVESFLFTDMRLGITSIQRANSFVFNSKQETYNGVILPNFCFHLSYSRTDEKIKRKIETFSHANQINKNWFEEVWKKWTPDSKNLHPITPHQYEQAIKENFLAFPDNLKLFIKKERFENYSCSIIILNYNSYDLLINCLNLIKLNTNKVYEIIIVDNGSKNLPDDFNGTLESYGITKIIINKENLGFPAAVNQGIKIADENNDICLMNVDAEPQSLWLENLYDVLNGYPNAGIIGPLGNEIENSYQKERMVLEDTRVFNVHFYCVLIFREVIERIGVLDERFGLGSYEDNDFCIRGKLSGFETWISSKSLVKHKAHQVFKLNGIDHRHLEEKNKLLLQDKLIDMLYQYSSYIDLISVSNNLAEKCGLIIKE